MAKGSVTGPVVGPDGTLGDTVRIRVASMGPAAGITAAGIGRAIRIGRALRGVSRQALADAAGVDGSYVSLLELGLRTPSLPCFAAVALALGIPPATLLLLAQDPAAQARMADAEAAAAWRRLFGDGAPDPTEDGDSDG